MRLAVFIHSDEWAEFQLTNHIRREWGNEGGGRDGFSYKFSSEFQ
jgi:hypothetical protein